MIGMKETDQMDKLSGVERSDYQSNPIRANQLEKNEADDPGTLKILGRLKRTRRLRGLSARQLMERKRRLNSGGRRKSQFALAWAHE